MVRIGVIDRPRKDYYDRNAVDQTQYWSVTVGAHGWTQRWSYTVPAGKKARHMMCEARTEFAIATAGRVLRVCTKITVDSVIRYFFAFYFYETDIPGKALTVNAEVWAKAGDAFASVTMSDDTISHPLETVSSIMEFDA